MSLFEQHPPPLLEEPAPRRPEWSARPENVVGAIVPFDLVLCSTLGLAGSGSASSSPTAARAVELWPDARPVGDEW